MVSIAAFLIICVILFGLEPVRSFIFGTLGAIGWIIGFLVVIFAALWVINSIDEGIKELREESKREKAQRKAEKEALIKLKTSDPKKYKEATAGKRLAIYMYGGALLLTAALCVFAIIAYGTDGKKDDTYDVLKHYLGQSEEYTFEGLEFESLESCKDKIFGLNMNRPNFDEQYPNLDDFEKLARTFRYYCGKNCDRTSTEPDKKCEEIID